MHKRGVFLQDEETSMKTAAQTLEDCCAGQCKPDCLQADGRICLQTPNDSSFAYGTTCSAASIVSFAAILIDQTFNVAKQ